MLSKILESVEYLCRNIRGGNVPFGGLQIIAYGDFYQLAPVDDDLYGDKGENCFKSLILIKSSRTDLCCHMFTGSPIII